MDGVCYDAVLIFARALRTMTSSTSAGKNDGAAFEARGRRLSILVFGGGIGRQRLRCRLVRLPVYPDAICNHLDLFHRERATTLFQKRRHRSAGATTLDHIKQ